MALLLNNLKTYFWKRALLRDSVFILRNKCVINLGKANIISIVYDASEEHDHHKVINFARKLQVEGKTIRALGYVKYRHIPHYCNPTLSWDFFTIKEINWFNRPDSIHIRDFLKIEPDILIYLDQNNNPALQYIAGLSRAKFKVGPYSEKYKENFDLMIDINSKIPIDELIEYLVKYLKMINKEANVFE